MAKGPQRSNYELKKLSDLWLDLAKVAFGSFVVKFLEPDGPKVSQFSVLVISLGLTVSFLFAKLGLKFARKVQDE